MASKTFKIFQTELFICMGIAVIISSILLWQRSKSSQPIRLTTPIVIDTTPTPETIPQAPRQQTTLQSSPDGTKKVMLTSIALRPNTIDYIIKTVDTSGENEHIVYSASTSASRPLSIPFNTWSPDNRYFFVQTVDGNAWVFSATGEEIVPGQMYIDVGSVFGARESTDSYKETTGWASPTLLIVNTTTGEEKKRSYWFEIPSQTIIQLASPY